jgi:DNA-binding IclR family transcriptional regulator
MRGKSIDQLADLSVTYRERSKGAIARRRRIAGSAAERALTILEMVTKADGPVASADLAPKLGLPRATAHRLAARLEHFGFLQREPGTKRFIVGPKLTIMALDALIHSPRRGERHAILRALVEEVGETCNVTVLDGDAVVWSSP